jgi:hypothetical protein
MRQDEWLNNDFIVVDPDNFLTKRVGGFIGSTEGIESFQLMVVNKYLKLFTFDFTG